MPLNVFAKTLPECFKLVEGRMLEQIWRGAASDRFIHAVEGGVAPCVNRADGVRFVEQIGREKIANEQPEREMSAGLSRENFVHLHTVAASGRESIA